jgi:uncharacterized protein (DUF4415 family)
MKKASTKTSSAKRPNAAGLKLSAQTKQAYANRNRVLDKDPDAPQLTPDYWANATIGKYYRPLKTQISLRIDNEVLDWLKSKGEGHLSRINEILRERMTQER